MRRGSPGAPHAVALIVVAGVLLWTWWDTPRRDASGLLIPVVMIAVALIRLGKRRPPVTRAVERVRPEATEADPGTVASASPAPTSPEKSDDAFKSIWEEEPSIWEDEPPRRG